jgi:hypothetical protein
VAPGAQESGLAWAQSGTGSISGRVFHDIDGDAIYDDGEPGVRRARVQLTLATILVAEDESDPHGLYSISGVAPGDYTLSTELDEQIGGCWDTLIGTFDPLAVSGCVHAHDIPWQATLPESLPVVLTAGASIQVDFGGVPADLMHLVGRAIRRAQYARQGDAVEAFANGALCGATIMQPNPDFAGALVFDLTVYGNDSVPGCAGAGDSVEFRVAGVWAEQTLAWSSYQQDPVRLRLLGLAATAPSAWYWFQGAETANVTAGAIVQASIGGAVCGSAVISVIPLTRPPGIAGFSQLVVPPDGELAGCGRPGAEVGFAVAGIRTANVVAWSPGLQRIDLTLPAPTGVPPSLTPGPTPGSLPGTGGSRGWTTGYTLIAVALVILGSSAVISVPVMAGAVSPHYEKEDR